MARTKMVEGRGPRTEPLKTYLAKDEIERLQNLADLIPLSVLLRKLILDWMDEQDAA